MIALDDNEKLSINKVLEVLIGVETLTNTSSFNTQSLKKKKLKKSLPGGLQLFLFTW